MKKIYGMTVAFLILFVCTAEAQLGSRSSRVTQFLKGQRVRTCWLSGKNCTALERKLISIAKSLDIFGMEAGIGWLFGRTQPKQQAAQEKSIESEEFLTLKPPAEADNKKGILVSAAEFMKTPEVIFCKKFGFCSSLSKLLIRSIEVALIIAGVASMQRLTRETTTKPSQIDYEKLASMGIEFIYSKEQEKPERSEEIFRQVQSLYGDTNKLNNYLLGISEIPNLVRYNGLSLIGALLPYMYVSQIADPNKVVAAIRLLSSAPFSISPTEADRIIWQLMHNVKKVRPYVEQLKDIFGE